MIIIAFSAFCTAFVSLYGGNSLLLLPILVYLGYPLIEIISALRIVGIVMVAFSILAVLHSNSENRKLLLPGKKDIMVICLSSFFSIVSAYSLTILTHRQIEIVVLPILIIIILLKVFQNKLNKYAFLDKPLIYFSIIFAGILGGVFGAAGLMLSILYLKLGYQPKQAIIRRLVPSLIIQLLACFIYVYQLDLNDLLVYVITIPTAVGSYFSIKLAMKIKGRFLNYVFYFSLALSSIMIVHRILS